MGEDEARRLVRESTIREWIEAKDERDTLRKRVDELEAQLNMVLDGSTCRITTLEAQNARLVETLENWYDSAPRELQIQWDESRTTGGHSR